MPAPAFATVLRQTAAIDGWFGPFDLALFLAAGAHQHATDLRGDLLEIGAYRGRSAVVLGHLRRADEQVIVCDVFEDGPSDRSSSSEWTTHYSGLAQAQFDANWARVHPEPPTVVRAPSAELPAHVASRSVRFVHVDGSHLQQEVAGDLDRVLDLVLPGAVLVFDDIFRPGSPGVAASVWPAVAADRLQPALLSGQKLYATVGDPAPVREGLLAGLDHLHHLQHDRQVIHGHEVALVQPHAAVDPVTGTVPLARRAAALARTLRRPRR